MITSTYDLNHATPHHTLATVDQSKPLDDWKPLLADRGKRRDLSLSMDYDVRGLSVGCHR